MTITKIWQHWHRLDLAAILHIDPMVISLWDKGMRKPSKSMLLRIARALKSLSQSASTSPSAV